MASKPRCCENGLIHPDGRQVCHRHATPEQRALVAELDERAQQARVLNQFGGWPYGPNIDVASRQRLLDWAEREGVSLATTRCQGMHWLRTGRCNVHVCEPLGQWADHVTRWKRDGKPGLIVAQPYGLDGNDMIALGQLAADDDLHVSVDADSWYGHGTVMVEVWNRQAWEKMIHSR